MKIKTQENYADQRSKHHPTPPCAPGDPGENLSGVPRCGRTGQVASAEWIHGQGSSPGGEGHTSGGLLPRLGGIADAVGETCRGRNSRPAMKPCRLQAWAGETLPL